MGAGGGILNNGRGPLTINKKTTPPEAGIIFDGGGNRGHSKGGIKLMGYKAYKSEEQKHSSIDEHYGASAIRCRRQLEYSLPTDPPIPDIDGMGADI